jgi:XTP/dITP diphosphohydrolase
MSDKRVIIQRSRKSMKTILVGSNNVHKAEEIRAILVGANNEKTVTVLMPSDVQGFPTDIPETGSTLRENALIKARAIVAAVPMTGITACVADDTGLEVDALDGAPGVRSARYASEDAIKLASGLRDKLSPDAANRLKLLNALRDVPPAARTARFRTVICLLGDSVGEGHTPAFAEPVFVEGVCEGIIATEERGEGGFGYDSVFMPLGYSVTFAQMSDAQKNSISHRGRALNKLVECFAEKFGEHF